MEGRNACMEFLYGDSINTRLSDRDDLSVIETPTSLELEVYQFVCDCVMRSSCSDWQSAFLQLAVKCFWLLVLLYGMTCRLMSHLHRRLRSSDSVSRHFCFLALILALSFDLFHRRTRASYVYNGCLAWCNVVLTPRVHSSVKFVGLPLATRATVE